MQWRGATLYSEDGAVLAQVTACGSKWVIVLTTNEEYGGSDDFEDVKRHVERRVRERART